MSKKTLKCTCRDCGAEFEMLADYLIPGVEGHMYLADGLATFLDPTRTNRMCDTCTDIALAKLMAGVEKSEVEEYR